MKIFGREPVYILAFVAIALKVASAHGLDLSAEAQGAVMVVLSLAVAVAEAVVLKTGAVAAAIVNLAQGVLAAFVAFGVGLSAEDQVLYLGLVEAAVALVIRKEVEAPVPATPAEQKSAVKI